VKFCFGNSNCQRYCQRQFGCLQHALTPFVVLTCKSWTVTIEKKKALNVWENMNVWENIIKMYIMIYAIFLLFIQSWCIVKHYIRDYHTTSEIYYIYIYIYICVCVCVCTTHYLMAAVVEAKYSGRSSRVMICVSCKHVDPWCVCHPTNGVSFRFGASEEAITKAQNLT
jgi:hypothetical protein